MLNSAVGVYSGDARNSGALDPNIRGYKVKGEYQSLSMAQSKPKQCGEDITEPIIVIMLTQI